ncbi:MAG: hypothetical protein J5764_01875 [Bacteroidales bacterium]|nr:hypothetical protein [Bacteroidales bacterium]
MKKLVVILALALPVLSAAKPVEPSFRSYTIPEYKNLKTAVDACRDGNEWDITVTVKNRGKESTTFKLVLAAEPRFEATSYLVPGINYNGNPYGNGMPQSWEKDGEPWIFSYDRGSIPSCTVSESDSAVFGLFASDCDTLSHVSACSMEKLPDGSFRHLIYWPVTEAPFTYSDKLKFSERYDTYLTLAPGQEIKVKAVACTGVPKWPRYGFAEVFPVAWKHLRHETPAQLSVSQTLAMDKAFMDWGRRRDENGWWFVCALDDMMFQAGYTGNGKSRDGYTLAEYEKNPELNRWITNDVEDSKHLKEGEYVKGPGRDLGFAAQSLQQARLAIEYGFRNDMPSEIDFGLKVLRSWIGPRMTPSGIPRPARAKWNGTRDACSAGWTLEEMARVSMLLREHGVDASEFEAVAAKVAKLVLDSMREDGNPGSLWNCTTGEVLARGGDVGGFVLMGLTRYWQLTRDPELVSAIDRMFHYYYSNDIDEFRCSGGAVDCASVDREGIHPFLNAAMVMYRETMDPKYLDYAVKAAWYALSWFYIQNPPYGPETDFSKMGWKPAGSTIIGTEHPALDDYGCAFITDFIHLSKATGNPMWKEIAALIWNNGTQGFTLTPYEVVHCLERPIGSKNEAYFMTRWSKYRTGERKRGHINDHLTVWAGVFRTACIYDLSVEDLLWLDELCRP